MSMIYVVNNAMHDYQNAERFGTIKYVTEGKVPIFKTDVVTKLLKDGLAEFTADDYILVSGPAWLDIIAALITFSKLNEVKFLVFDAKERMYIVRHLKKELLGYHKEAIK